MRSPTWMYPQATPEEREELFTLMNQNHELRAEKYTGVHLVNVDDLGNHLYLDLTDDHYHITTGDDPK